MLCALKARLPQHLESQSESLINNSIFLTSMADSSVNASRKCWALTKNVDNSLPLPQRICTHGRSRELAAAFFPQRPVIMATAIDMMPRPSPGYWFVRLLSTKGKVYLTMVQGSLKTQDSLASRRHFLIRTNLAEVIPLPKSLKKIPDGEHQPCSHGRSC